MSITTPAANPIKRGQVLPEVELILTPVMAEEGEAARGTWSSIFEPNPGEFYSFLTRSHSSEPINTSDLTNCLLDSIQKGQRRVLAPGPNGGQYLWERIWRKDSGGTRVHCFRRYGWVAPPTVKKESPVNVG